MIYKELTVKQLVKLTSKDASTITRNLNKLQESKLVEISKTDTIRNFNINFWKLNPKIPLHEFGDFDRIITEALINNDIDFLKTLLVTTQRIIWSILNHKTRNIHDFIQSLKEEKTGEFMSMALMDKETGQLFRKQIAEFIAKFYDEHKINMLPLDKIGPESFISFIFLSHFSSLPLFEADSDMK